MKKLMIAVAIVCAAVCANAAALNWYMAGHDGVLVNEDYGWIDGGQAYLVMVTDAANFAVANDLSITGGAIVDSTAFVGGEAVGAWQSTGDLVDGREYLFAIIGTTGGTSAGVPDPIRSESSSPGALRRSTSVRATKRRRFSRAWPSSRRLAIRTCSNRRRPKRCAAELRRKNRKGRSVPKRARRSRRGTCRSRPRGRPGRTFPKARTDNVSPSGFCNRPNR